MHGELFKQILVLLNCFTELREEFKKFNKEEYTSIS
jgi:hypothetical protein